MPGLQIIFAPLAPVSNSKNHEKTFISVCRSYFSYSIMQLDKDKPVWQR